MIPSASKVSSISFTHLRIYHFLCAGTVSSFPPFRVSSGHHENLLLSTNSAKMPLKSQTAFSLTPSLSRHASVRRLPRPQIAAMWVILPRHLVGSTPTPSISGYLHSRKTFPPFRVSSVLVTPFNSLLYFFPFSSLLLLIHGPFERSVSSFL